MRTYGKGRVFARGGNLWISYCYRGKECRERALDKKGNPTNDREEAEKCLEQRRNAIITENGGGPQFETPTMRRLTIHDLLEGLRAKYKANGQESPQNLSHLKRADDDLGYLPACSATSKHFRDYRNTRPDDPVSSVNRVLQMVRAAFRLAAKRGEVTRVPFIEILSEKGNERTGFASEQQIADVLAALPDDGLRDFCEWAAETGQRKSEMAALTWAMYDAATNQLHIPAKVCKGRKARTIALGQTLQKIIERRKSRKRVEKDGVVSMVECPYLFHRGGLRVGDFKRSWATATKVANCEGLLLHDLRRTVARRLIASGVPTQVAKTMTGHESDSVFERYAIVDAALQLAAQEKVAAVFPRRAAK